MAVLKTVPFPHQAAELALSGSRSGWGFFWEMGTGKTLEAIMQFSRLHDAGEINGLLVLAPNGVHRNWVTDELPEHFASANEYAVHLWMTSKAETKRHAEAAELLLKAPAGALRSSSAASAWRFVSAFDVIQRWTAYSFALAKCSGSSSVTQLRCTPLGARTSSPLISPASCSRENCMIASSVFPVPISQKKPQPLREPESASSAAWCGKGTVLSTAML